MKNFKEINRTSMDIGVKKNTFLKTLLVLIGVLVTSINTILADEGWWPTGGGYVRFYRNDTYEYGCTVNGTDISDYDMENIDSDGGLIITDTWAKVFGGTNLWNSITLYWRVKERDTDPGTSYNNINMNWHDNMGGDWNQFWNCTGLSVEVPTTGLAAGDYEVEFYFVANKKGGPDYYYSNNSGNYHANFTLRRKITYHTDGSTSGSAPSVEWFSSATAKVKDNTGLLKKTGKVFAGWATSLDRANAGTIDYIPGKTSGDNQETFTITSDVDLYPVWTNGHYLIEPGTTTKDETNFLAPQNLAANTDLTVNGVKFSTHSYNTSNTKSAISGQAYDAGKMVVYDTQTDETDVTIYVYNSNSSTAKDLYYNVFKEGAAASSDVRVSVPAKGSGKVIVIPHISNSIGARVVICLNSSDLSITQIRTVETGEHAVKQAGQSGFALAVPGRPSTGLTTGGVESPNQNTIKFGSGSTNWKVKGTNGSTSTQYIKFTTTSATQLQVTTLNDSYHTFYLKKGSAALNTSTDAVYSGQNTTININLSETGTWYILGTQANIKKVAFADHVACAAPTSLAASNISSDGATLTVTDGSTRNYEFYVSTSGTSPNANTAATHSVTSSKTINIGSLTASTNYYAWVRATNDHFNHSTWVALGTPGYFTTSAAATTYSVTAVTSTGDDTYGTVAAGDDELEKDGTTTITASPETGYQVTAWEVSGTGASIDDDGSTHSNTTTLTMGTADATVTVTFGAIDYTVDYNDPGNSNNYTTKVASGSATSADKMANYGQTVAIVATPTSGYAFSSWTITNTDASSDATSTLLGANSTTASTSFTMPAYNVSIEATFVPTYVVTKGTPSGGDFTIATSPAISGATITLTASPSDGYNFSNWAIKKTSDGSDVTSSVSLSSSSTSPATFTMPAYGVTVNATFALKTYAVTYAAGTYGSGSLSGGTKTHGETYVLSDEDDAFTRTGYTYDGWATSDGGDKAYDLGGDYTTNSAQCFYPHWVIVNYTITHSDATNGTYTISVAGGDETSSNTTANYGQTITLAATPSLHYKLQAWNVTKTSGGDAVSVTDNTFSMPAEAVTIAPTFGRVYTVTFRTYGGSSVSPIEQSTIGGSITMPSTTTSNDSTFTGWMIGGTTVAAGASYTPTADVYAYATWKKNCAGGGGSTLFSQSFDSDGAGSVAYTESQSRAYTTESGLTGIVGSGSNLFTSISCDKGSGRGIGINHSTGGNSKNYTGKFGMYSNGGGNTGYSLMRTADFAATAPTAIKIEFNALIAGIESQTKPIVYVAVGDGMTDGLTTSLPAYDKMYTGFGIFHNYNSSTSYLDPCKFGVTSQGDRIFQGGASQGQITHNSNLKYTWVVNATGDDLEYTDPTGGTTELATGKWDLWVGTTKVVSAYDRATGGSTFTGSTMQELYIGCHNTRGEFVLDDVVVTDLTPGSSCYHITYNGNGADAGYENDARAYSSGDNAWVSTNSYTNSFTREGYEFNGWNNKADGSGTDYDFWTSSDHVVMTQDTTLYAQWRIIIDEDNINVSGFETPQYKDVVVRNGATLTITEDMSVRNITVESGSTLHVAKNGEEGVTFATKSLSLKGGYYTKSDYSESYDMPRVYINPASKITRTNKTINFDFAVTNNYHPIAVPFPVKVNDVNYVKESLAYIAEYGKHYNIKTYDGAARANGSYACWTSVPLGEYVGLEYKYTYLEPGRGYILAAKRGKGDLYALIRFPMKNVEDDWLKTGELGHYTDGESVTHVKDTVRVTAYLKDGDSDGSKTPKTHKGWNILGIPYMSCYQTSADMYDGAGSATIMQGKFDFSTNTFDDKDKNLYVSVPTHDFSEYLQYNITDENTKLLPGWCFFVQVETSGRLTFLSAKEMMDSELAYRAPQREQASMPTVKTGIILSGADASDKTTFLVSDKYDGSEYEINADLEKMFGETGYTLATYSLMGTTRLAYNALSNAEAQNIIPIGYRAPEDGEYTFSINPRYADNFAQVNLIDYQEGTVTNLLQSTYTFTTVRTQNDARFALNVVPKAETPTDIENGGLMNGENGVRKVLINNQLYIIRDGKMYDATGKSVK